MKKSRLLWMSALLTLAIGTGSCSKDDDEDIVIDPDGIIDYQFSEDLHTEKVDGCTITRDESDRIVRLEYFVAGTDPEEKLYSCPSSFDEIKHLFPMSEGNEIRLEGTTEWETPNGERNEYSELYQHYYKGVLVDGFKSQVFYFITPEGKRMIRANTQAFFDIKDVNPIPAISEQKARQIFADYLKTERNDNWPCKLSIKEYSTRKGDTVVRKHILVYDVTADIGTWFCKTGMAISYAQIDAQTGHFIAAGKYALFNSELDTALQ